MNLKELAAVIIAAKFVSPENVELLNELIFEDGVVSKEEVDILFEINDAISGSEKLFDYENLFIEAVASYVLDDEESPDVISEEEGRYLVEKIKKDGEIDSLEKELLFILTTSAGSIDSEELIELIDSIDESEK